MALLLGRMLPSQLSLAAVVLMLLATTLLLAAAQAPPPDCKESCGNVSIPYPFGLTDGCYLYVPGQESQQFKLACNTTTSRPTLNFLDSDNFPTNISNIFVGESALQVMVTSSQNCYNDSGIIWDLYRDSVLNLPPSYTLADKNKLYNIGCNKATRLYGYPLHVTDPEQPFEVRFSGVSMCQDEFGKRFPDTCTGFGCSVNSIPGGLQNYTAGVWSLGGSLGKTAQWGVSYPCSYGFVVDERNFTFAGNQSFKELTGARQQLPVLVNWAIGNDNCEAAKKKNETAYACKDVNNAKCVNLSGGYFCQCKEGYQGNPYLLDNCIDIDECQTNPCSDHAKCENSPAGSYTCKCDNGYRNDDHDKNMCVLITETSNKNAKVMKISLGVCLSFLVVVSITFWMYHVCKKGKFKRLTATYVERNGGSLLRQELEKYQGSKKPRIFTFEELKKATNNFAAAQVIGQGTYASVYKGTLPDNKKVVAIKKSKSGAPTVVSQSQWQFVNELLVLSGIHHKNFVTLIGCCLEDKTPMLVYEFVGNGTLHEHIHKRNAKGPLPPLPFGQRMKIAAEIAGSLANLHHHESTQTQYQEERCRLSHPKTTNILLDDYFTAKVSDFTASKFVPRDPNILQATPGGQATFVYVDPEYFESHKLTEKSDVYSYGVVLVELLTSRPLAVFNKTEAEKNLAKFFLKSMGDEQLDQILDHEIIKEEESFFEIAKQVAQLAKRCLSLKGADRPTMRDVETELRAIWEKCPGGMPDSSHTETHYLLAASPSNAYTVDIRSDDSHSMESQAQMMKRYDGGR